jgi:hypothetical protein
LEKLHQNAQKNELRRSFCSYWPTNTGRSIADLAKAAANSKQLSAGATWKPWPRTKAGPGSIFGVNGKRKPNRGNTGASGNVVEYQAGGTNERGGYYSLSQNHYPPFRLAPSLIHFSRNVLP